MVYDDGRGDELYRLDHGELIQMHPIRIAAVSLPALCILSTEVQAARRIAAP